MREKQSRITDNALLINIQIYIEGSIFTTHTSSYHFVSSSATNKTSEISNFLTLFEKYIRYI